MEELQSYRRSRRRTVPLVVDRPESDHEEEDLQTPYSRGSRRRTAPMAEEREEEDMAEILCRRSLRKKRQVNIHLFLHFVFLRMRKSITFTRMYFCKLLIFNVK